MMSAQTRPMPNGGGDLSAQMMAFAENLLETPPGLVAAIGFGMTLLYCVLAWRRVNRDWEPLMGHAVTRPSGLSAATLRYVRSGRFDAASLTAGILALAAKGALLVERHPSTVRLRKAAVPVTSLTRAERAFADGLVRLRSTLLLNDNAGPALRMGAAALQDGIVREWQGYQEGRIKGLFRPAILIAILFTGAAAFLSETPVWVLGRALLTAVVLVFAVRFLIGMGRALHRLWRQPLRLGALAALRGVIALGLLALAGLILFWQGGRPDPEAAVFGSAALALPFVIRRMILSGRGAAGPLIGRIEALRNQLLGKSRGIDAVVDASEPAAARIAAPPASEPPPGTFGVVEAAQGALKAWLADALALDAVAAPPSLQVARLERTFKEPARLAAVLRAVAPAEISVNADP